MLFRSVVRFYSTREGAVGRSHHQEQVLAPLDLGEDEIADLVAFLRSLEGAPLAEEIVGPPTRSPRDSDR